MLDAMRSLIPLAAAAITFVTPAHAESELEKGFAGALRGCGEWVLNPASWSEGTDPFVSTVALGPKMGLVDKVDPVSLPPEALRVGNHYWRINATAGAGFILVVSDQLPMCHITGGGDTDLQPTVESVLRSSEFTSRWEKVETNARGEMASTAFRNREDPDFTMIVSRAKQPGGRLDRVQVLATATYQLNH